jgi:hypothetical protein
MRSPLLPFFALTSLLAAGCAPEDDADPTGEAEQAQIQFGPQLARVVRLVFADTARTPFAEIHIVSAPTALHQPGLEYWYVNRDATRLLATTPLDISVTDFTIDPPDPDYPNEQTFTQTEFPTSGWGSGFSVDPLSYGKLFGNGSGLYLRLATTTSGDVSRVAWYQVIPATQSPQWLTPSGHFVSSGSSVIVGRGYRGYDIDQAAP